MIEECKGCEGSANTGDACQTSRRVMYTTCSNRGAICSGCAWPEGWSFPTRFCEKLRTPDNSKEGMGEK